MFYKFMLIVAAWIIYPFLRLFNRIEIIGTNNIPKEGPVVIASNHLSLWDPVYLFCCIDRKLNFMAKEELFSVPIIGWIISHVNAFPVRRNSIDRNALRQAAHVLANNEALVLFPEGTRSVTGELLPFYDGAVLFAQRSQATIVPVAIYNSKNTFPKGFRQKVQIRFGEPMDFTEYQGKKVNSKILGNMTNTLWQQIKQLQGTNEVNL